MLGPGHYGDFIITEAPDYMQGDARDLFEEVTVSKVNVCLVDECERPMLIMGLCREHASEELYNCRRQRLDCTQVQCVNCEHGVQNQHSVCKMCPTCAEETIRELREECRLTGIGYRHADEEVGRLRGIEAAAYPPPIEPGESRSQRIRRLRDVADQIEAFAILDISPWLYALADALEATP